MKPKYRVWHKKFGMCEVTWLEFTLDNSDKDSYPFLLGGLITQEGKIIKEARINPKTLMQSTELANLDGTEYDWWQHDIIELPGGTIGYLEYVRVDAAWYLLDKDEKTIASLAFTRIDGKKIGNKWKNPELLEGSHEANSLT